MVLAVYTATMPLIVCTHENVHSSAFLNPPVHLHLCCCLGCTQFDTNSPADTLWTPSHPPTHQTVQAASGMLTARLSSYAGSTCVLPGRCVSVHATQRSSQLCTLPGPLPEGPPN